MNIPEQFTAGDSLTWYEDATTDNIGRTLSSPDWTLTVAFRGAASLDVVATNENGRWKLSVSAADSDIAAGVYYWQAFVEKDAEKITIGAGQTKVVANLFDKNAGYDGRSQAEQDLAAVQAAMRAIISGGAVQSYTIGNRTLNKMAMTDLIALESKLKIEVVREKKAAMAKNGLGNPHSLYVRFK